MKSQKMFVAKSKYQIIQEYDEKCSRLIKAMSVLMVNISNTKYIV